MVKPVWIIHSHANFKITKVIFIYLAIKTYDIPAKTSNPTNNMDNSVYIFLHFTLVTSLSTADLTHNFSKSNYTYPYYKLYKLCSGSTNSFAVVRIIIQTLDTNSCYNIIIQPLPKFSSSSCLDDLLEKWCYKIIQVWYFISTNT